MTRRVEILTEFGKQRSPGGHKRRKDSRYGTGRIRRIRVMRPRNSDRKTKVRLPRKLV